MGEFLLTILKALLSPLTIFTNLLDYIWHFAGQIVTVFSWMPATFSGILGLCLTWAILLKIIGRDG